MTEDAILHGIGPDVGLTRRTFGVAAAVSATVGAAGGAMAEAQIDEKDVTVNTPDGKADAALFHPAGSGRWPVVLIWTDILGLRPAFRQMGRRLAAQGYVVLVPNPFYRVKRAPIVDAGFDFSKPEDRAKVMPLMQALTTETTMRDAPAFLTFLDAQPQADTGKKAGVQGYCMGGALAFRAAAALPDRVGAMGSFHGGNLVTEKPDSPHKLVARVKAHAYCGVADNDDKKDPHAKDALRTAFATAQLPARVEVYEGANHGWCVRDNASYNEAAAERAWSELTALYNTALA